MDLSAVNVNVTVDDFDSVIAYPDQSVWQTPDPSSPTFNPNTTFWWMGTYHKTSTINASLSFNFTGPAIYVYGGSGPSYGSYRIQIDNDALISSAYAPNNISSPHLLYGSANLTYAPHTLTIQNLGAQTDSGDAGGDDFLFDSLESTVQIAPAGATVSNTTFQETDPSLKYTGTWGNNTSANFSGGGSAFTNQDKATVSLSFHGSAIYVFGDKKNDHGLYGVTLDSGVPQVFDGISGCGGAFGMTCEQQQPTLAYFASNLDGQPHTLVIQNMAGVNNSFFDLDSIVVSVPSVYAPRQVSNTTSSSLSSISPAPSSTGRSSSSAMGKSTLDPSLPLFFIFMWFLRLFLPSLR